MGWNVTKILYPSAGLTKNVENKFETICMNLDNANSGASSLKIPDDFEMASYLQSLPSLISNYKQTITTLKEEAATDDNNYNNLNDSIKSSTAAIEVVAIAKRDPIING